MSATNNNVNQEGFEVVTYKKHGGNNTQKGGKSAAKASQPQARAPTKGGSSNRGKPRGQGASKKAMNAKGISGHEFWGGAKQPRADREIQGALPSWYKEPEWDRRSNAQNVATTDTKVTPVKKAER